MNKQQSTQAGWVSAQPQVTVQSESTQGHNPTHKGEISNWRVGVFFVLALAVALALGWLAMAWGMTAAIAVFVVVLLGVFAPFYLIDSVLSSGYLHERARLIVESEKTQAADRAALFSATTINAEQQAQLEQLWTAIHHIDERLKALDTIKIQSRDGVRTVAKHDDIDSDIDRWMASMFDANGQIVGIFPSGVIKDKYPFKGESDAAKAAHHRLIKAGLVGRNETSKQYTWVGPMTLSETRKRLYPAKV